MSSSSANLHIKRLPSETEHAQRVPDVGHVTQQLKLRERQRFFEEVFQHDVDVFLSSAHLQIDYKRPPLGSISSMEVNVDMLEQMDLMDISDQEALDVFLSASGEDGLLASPLPVHGVSNDNNNNNKDDEVISRGLSRRVSGGREGASRISSSSSSNSQNTNEDGGDTPVVQSDDEDVHDAGEGRRE